MLSYYLKCKKNTENINPRVINPTCVILKQYYYQNVIAMVVKHQNLLRNKTKVGY